MLKDSFKAGVESPLKFDSDSHVHVYSSSKKGICKIFQLLECVIDHLCYMLRDSYVEMNVLLMEGELGIPYRTVWLRVATRHVTAVSGLYYSPSN